jgi:hypothetical protein
MPWKSLRVRASLAIVIAGAIMMTGIVIANENASRLDMDLKEQAKDIVTVDIDADGDQDVAVSSEDKIFIYRNVGGDIDLWKTIEGAGGPIVVTDFDGDGYPGFLLRDGQVRSSRADFTVIGQDGGYLARDLDQDGDLDILDLEDGALVIRFCDGNTYVDTKLETGKKPTAVAVANIDHVGGLDIVVANGEAGIKENITNPTEINIADLFAIQKQDQNSISLFLESGGSWTRSDYKTGRHPIGLVIMDVNGDGLSDIVTANAIEDTVTYLKGKQLGGSFDILNPLGSLTGIFEEKVDFPIAHAPLKLMAGDLDKDWDEELVILCRPLKETGTVPAGGISSVTLLGVPGDINFNDPEEIEIAYGAQGIALADMDGDGDRDIVTAGKSMTILYNDEGDFSDYSHWMDPYFMAIPVAICGIGSAGVIYPIKK